MSIKLNGIKNEIVTFKANGEIPVGTPVLPSSNYTVAASSAGAPFLGVVVNKSKDLVGVQLTGYFELPFSSTAPYIGFSKLVADGNGGVKVDSAIGQNVAVVYVNSANKTVGFLM